MKALLIKTDTSEVVEVEYNGRFVQAAWLLECKYLEPHYLRNGDVVLVDEEGRLNANTIIKGEMQLYNMQFVGRALIHGLSGRGNAIPPATTLEELKREVKFISTMH